MSHCREVCGHAPTSSRPGSTDFVAHGEDSSELPMMTLSNSTKRRKSFYASPENAAEEEALPSSAMPQPPVERHASVQSHNKISLLNEQQANDIPQPSALMLQMLQRRMPWRLSRSMSMNLPTSLPIYGERNTSLNSLTRSLRTCVVGGCDRFQCRAGYCQSHAEVYLSAELGPDAISGSGIENYDEIPFEDIKLDEVIGNGAFGKVYRANLWGQVVAVKMLRPSKREDTDDIEDLIMKEAAIMRSLRHPNIVEFMGIARERNGRIAIVTELLESGGLDDYLLKRKKLSWKRYFEIAKDIACGLNWLHRKGIIHRDLKPSNILISRNMNAKIADFGLSHVRKHPYLKGGHYGVAGTPCYISPEVLREEPYDTKADVFSFGVVLCEMLTGSYPFATLYDMKMPQSCFEHSIISGERPRIPDDCHSALRDLINECWRGNPRLRPTMGQVLPMLEDCERIMLKAQRFVLEEVLNEHLPEDVRAALEDQRLIYEEAQTELKAVKLSVAMLNLKKTELENELRASEEAIQMAILQRDRFRSNFYRAQQELDRLHGNNRGDGMGQRFQQTYRPRPLKRTLSSQRRFFAERMRRS